MSNTQILFGLLVAAVLVVILWRQTKLKEALAATSAELLFSDVTATLDDAQRVPGDSAGSWKVSGRYGGEFFQFMTVTDTLAVRKLPSLWLLVTLPKQLGMTETIDLMMRPTGPTTFSRFDFLPHRLDSPAGFPEHAVIRSDVENATVPVEAMRPALALFHANKGKELLISPRGLRIVVQLAEADRARYGVFREARFDEAHIDGTLATTIMNTLLKLDKDLATHHA